MRKFANNRALALVALIGSHASSLHAQGAGDLLVAPTRVVLDGARGTEVILNNIGAAPATYRISLELRRMRPDGSLEEIEPSAANAVEATTLGMISYAPRRVTLPPNQPQSIRIGIRAPQSLPDGEYRAHMLFRAIPDSKPAVANESPKEGVSIALTPIYGVTIPIIVRQGNLSAKAAISDARVEKGAERDSFSFALSRTGTRSTYGRIRVIRAGFEKPLIDARGIAVYADISDRRVVFPVDAELAAKLKGPATIQYLEDIDAGGGVIAELQTVIR
ncbi:MAG: molecular chaperone [Pseudomonadota bacterium]